MANTLIPYKKQHGGGKKFDPKSFGISWNDLIPALVILLIVALAFVAVSFWKSSLEEGLKAINVEQAEIEEELASAETQEVQQFAKRAQALQSILRSRPLPDEFPQPLFAAFDSSVHNSVTINEFSLNVSEGTITISGFTSTFEAVGEQIAIWREEADFVDDVTLDSFGRDSEGAVNFSASLELDDNNI